MVASFSDCPSLGDIRLVRGTILVGLAEQPLVGTRELPFEEHGAGAREEAQGHHASEGGPVLRLFGGQEEVGGDEVADLGQHVADGNGDGTLLRRATHGARDHAHDHGIGDVHAADVDERRAVAGVRVAGREANDEPARSDHYGDGVVPPALLDPVRVPRVGVRAESSENVRRRGEHQRDGGRVSETADNLEREALAAEQKTPYYAVHLRRGRS